MKTQNVTKIILIHVAILLSSCIKDINIDLPNEDEKVVVNCFFSPDSLWNVYVGVSTQLDENYKNKAVTDAVVAIFENDSFSTSLNYANGKYVSNDVKPKAGNTYKIIVSIPGFDPVSAVDSIPPEKAKVVKQAFDTIPRKYTTNRLFEEVFVNKVSIEIKTARF